MPILSRVEGPQDLKGLSHEQLAELAQDCRDADHPDDHEDGRPPRLQPRRRRADPRPPPRLRQPEDRLVWDTSNQCYTHKLVTGRRDQFSVDPDARAACPASPSRPRASTTPWPPATPGPGSPYGLGMSIATQARPGRPVRRRHRRRRLADLGPELRGAQQHRPRQAQAPHRHPQRQRLVDLRERRLARPLAQPLRAPPDVPEVHRGRPQLLQAAAQGRQGLGARAQGQELGRGPLPPEPDLGRDRLPLRRPRQRPRLSRARRGARARPGRLEGRHAGRHSRPDAQGPRLPAGRAEPLQVPPAGHAHRARAAPASD